MAMAARICGLLKSTLLLMFFSLQCWIMDYDEQALLTRMKTRTKLVNKRNGQGVEVEFDHSQAPQSVKFFSRKDKDAIKCHSYKITVGCFR